MLDSVKRKCCPKCGGKIRVSFLYQTSHDYTITKKGVLSKRFTKDGEHSMECAVASCKKCFANWNTEEFWIDEDGCFWDDKYAEDGV